MKFYPLSCASYLTFSSGEQDEGSFYGKCVAVTLARAEIWTRSNNDSKSLGFIPIEILSVIKITYTHHNTAAANYYYQISILENTNDVN